MMIKCQKCGFENQMGSIFCRECGEKLNMDAIDPNKLQKDVNKEKNIKLAKKRIKGAISGGISLLIIVAFIFLVFPDLFPFGKLRQYEEPAVNDASANQKFNSVVSGGTVGKASYSYPELNRMFKMRVVDPMSEIPSFAKVTNAEITFDEAKNQPVVYLWISIKGKVPVVYTVHGDIVYNVPAEDADGPQSEPLTFDVKRLDIGRLPLFISTKPFLDGFLPLIENDEITNFFARAKNVEFTPEGMNVEFAKGGPTVAPSPAPKASASAGVAALKGGSTAALSEKDQEAAERKRQLAEEKKRKAEEEAEKKKQLEEERKRKAEEYKQQQKEKEEESKRKLEEEKERKKQEAEEKKRKAEEEADRRRQEAEERRREREDRRNNNYNNNRSSRSSRSSRNRY